MIEISEKVSQVVYFPKTMKSTGPYTLKIHSELSQKDWYIDNLLDQANLNDYYKFTVDFTEVDDGEFNYSISKADDTFDTGLIRIGVVQNYGQGYDTDVQIIQYDQYSDPQIRYQHKSISALTNGNYYVTPDEGYVALSEVDIYVNVPQTGHTDEELQEAYSSGYTNGYDSGWTDGYISGYTDASGQTPTIPLTFNIISAGTVSWHADESADTKTIQYSLNNGEWTNITSSTGSGTEIAVNPGDIIRFRGDNATYSPDRLRGNNFNGSTAWFEVEGNIMSLIDSTGYTTATTLASSHTFNDLFFNCTGLTSAENLLLPATTLAKYCYRNMFGGCRWLTKAPALPATTLADGCYERMFQLCSTGLTTAPELPATTLADYCYQYMFLGCESLTQAPELPATTLTEYCYYNMFYNCISLTTAPALPATTLGRWCYGRMFEGCTSLTTAPELPAIILTGACYAGMFVGCTSLTSAPTLPATILAGDCYREMFDGCTSLTTAPALPVTTLTTNCYLHMFRGCTSLTTAPALPATTLANYCYRSMFQGCTSLTTAPELPATTLSTFCYREMFWGCTSLTTAPALPVTTLTTNCYTGMFRDCTSLTIAPELPAITLAFNCYNSMFQGCTSLTTAPELPATTLADSCYGGMFSGCTSLNYIKCLATDISATDCTYNWVTSVASTGTFIKDPNMESWSRDDSGIPDNWTVQDAQ